MFVHHFRLFARARPPHMRSNHPRGRVHHPYLRKIPPGLRAGSQVRQCLETFPTVTLEANVQPITRSVLRVRLTIEATFKWRDASHGNALKWLLWVEDSNNEHIYHSETFFLTKKAAKEGTHQGEQF